MLCQSPHSFYRRLRGTYPDDALLNILASLPHLRKALLAVTSTDGDDPGPRTVILRSKVILRAYWGLGWLRGLREKEWEVFEGFLGRGEDVYDYEHQC
jgi:hypothetical protein